MYIRSLRKMKHLKRGDVLFRLSNINNKHYNAEISNKPNRNDDIVTFEVYNTFDSYETVIEGHAEDLVDILIPLTKAKRA